MFTTTKITAATLLLASHVWATNYKGIPAAFSAGFDPQLGLRITYEATDGTVNDGDDLTGLNLTKVPKFSLGQSSGVNTNARFIVLMVDPDVNGDPGTVVPQTLHYLRTDFIPTGEGFNIASEIPPAVKYVGPEATEGGTEGAHRYVFLLYQQPKDFVMKGVDPEKRVGFNAKAWRDENGLQPAISGVHFMATPHNAGTSTTLCTSNTQIPTYNAPASEEQVYSAPPPTETAPATEEPVYTVPVSDQAQTIIHTVTVTDNCDCTAAPGVPAETVPVNEGTTITAENPAPTDAPPAVATHKVIVGGPGGLVYTPEWIEAAPGDTVHFEFLATNHTVTQSTLDFPCVFKPDGIKSGFRFNPNSTPGKETFEIVVPDSDPKWYYCAQGNHCASGMVFAINPKDKFQKFKDNAMNGNATTYQPLPTNSTVPPLPVFAGAASGLVAKMEAVVAGFIAVVAFLV